MNVYTEAEQYLSEWDQWAERKPYLIVVLAAAIKWQYSYSTSWDENLEELDIALYTLRRGHHE